MKKGYFFTNTIFSFREPSEDDPVDLDIAQESQPLVKKGVRIAPNLMVVSNVLVAKPDKGESYEWSALTITRGKKDDGSRPFRYNLPFSCTPKLIEGLQYLVKENKSFFTSANGTF